MPWQVEFSPTAERDISTIEKPVRIHILERIAWFTQNFDSLTPFPLHGEWRGLYKFRTNDYRIIYKLKHKTRDIRIEYIDHRSKVYKKKQK